MCCGGSVIVRTRAVIGLAAFVALGLVIYLLREVMLPFVAGITLAYLLDPLADRLERLGLGRLAASLLILALFVVALDRDAADPGPAHRQPDRGALVNALPGMVSRLQAIIADRSGSAAGAHRRRECPERSCNPRSAPSRPRRGPGSWPS